MILGLKLYGTNIDIIQLLVYIFVALLPDKDAATWVEFLIESCIFCICQCTHHKMEDTSPTCRNQDTLP